MNSPGILASKEHLENQPCHCLQDKIELTFERTLQPVPTLMSLIVSLILILLLPVYWGRAKEEVLVFIVAFIYKE
jgi:hypothetical protein